MFSLLETTFFLVLRVEFPLSQVQAYTPYKDSNAQLFFVNGIAAST